MLDVNILNYFFHLFYLFIITPSLLRSTTREVIYMRVDFLLSSDLMQLTDQHFSTQADVSVHTSEQETVTYVKHLVLGIPFSPLYLIG